MPNSNIKKLVDQYCVLTKKILDGDRAAAEKMPALWDDDCVIEMSGPEPMSGTFRGQMAVKVLYKNMATGAGADIKIGRVRAALKTEKFSIDDVVFEGDKAIISWSHAISMNDKTTLLKGQSTLAVRGAKIISGRTVMMDMPAAKPGFLPMGLELEKLKVMDIGRLALAAWAVV